MTLSAVQEESGSSTGVTLAGDPQLPERLLVASPYGVHAVALPWLPQLARCLSAGMHLPDYLDGADQVCHLLMSMFRDQWIFTETCQAHTCS